MLYIRTDMNDRIATGHVMRCLAIADAAKSRGEDTVFILADRQAVGLIGKRGYESVILHTKWDDMESELSIMENLIQEKQIQSIFIDSYQVTFSYLEKLAAMTRTVYLDDLNAFFYPVNAIVCYANYWEKFHYPERYQDTELYLGTKYVPLRKEFFCRKKKNIKPQAENLLLMSGGADTFGILPQMLERLEKEPYQRIDVICGIYNTNYASLKSKYQSCANIYIHKAVDNIEFYMEQADLAVSAGGTTLYELCALGTPAISYSIADNQLENVRKFHEDGSIDYAGDIRKEDVISNLTSLLASYRANQPLRAEKSKKMQSLVDGGGAGRIAEIL